MLQKLLIPSIPIDINLIGISYIVKNELAILPAVPNVVIIENAIGPQEHAPAEAPINSSNYTRTHFSGFFDEFNTINIH